MGQAPKRNAQVAPGAGPNEADTNEADTNEADTSEADTSAADTSAQSAGASANVNNIILHKYLNIL